MNFHRVRRLAEILVASQLRSGRTDSDPKSLLGRGIIVAIADVGLFLAAFTIVDLVLGSIGLTTAGLTLVVYTFAPIIPLVATAAVLIAGVMFELTNSTKFAGSDAANWLPITPSEYVLGSALAIAYSYSPGIALLLGGLLPVAIAAGLGGMYALVAALTAVSLVEGAVLIEMVRAVAQRTGSSSTGRHARLTVVVRAALLVVLILIFDLAFNPVIVLGFVNGFHSVEWVTALVPFLWSTRALIAWAAGFPAIAVAFAAGQFVFVGLLVYLAAELRRRYWVPNPTEIGELAPVGMRGHPYLTALGLSEPEAAIASKDLLGFVRRRELLPNLVIPIVLLVLLIIEGAAFAGLNSLLWVGWVVGFFALLLSVTSVGQERRSLQTLYAYPITSRSVLRAKTTAVLVPVLFAGIGMPVAVSIVFHYPWTLGAEFVLASSVGGVLLALWGLVFASRFSDFQDRPRAQFIRPGAMLAALGTGMVVLFSFLVPASAAMQSPYSAGLALGLGAAAVAIVAGALAIYLARAGFDRLFRQLPF